MKLIKYILFIIILIASVVFIKELDSINTLSDGSPMKIKIPYLTNLPSSNHLGIIISVVSSFFTFFFLSETTTSTHNTRNSPTQSKSLAAAYREPAAFCLYDAAGADGLQCR